MADDMNEYWASLSLTIKAESEEEADEWLRSLSRDLLGMEKIIGITFRVGDLEDSEVED